MTMRLFGFAMAMIVAAGSAAAQTVGGEYAVSGTNFNGSHYSGTAQITASGSGCRITWQTGSTSSRGTSGTETLTPR